jgi:tryptophan synthase alpha chain
MRVKNQSVKKMNRIESKFNELRSQQKCGFVAYICAGDPDLETSAKLLDSMPEAGVDIIELGVPFLDPAGDGVIIQNAARRAVVGATTLIKVLEMVATFRKKDQNTPLILMSYYNPILKYGLDKIFIDAAKSGVDGFLIVDLPLEEEKEIAAEIKSANLDLVGLIAPTTSKDRAKKIAEKSSGFLYLISLLGITGTKTARLEDNLQNLQNLREASNLPVVIGFGIKEPSQAKEFSKSGAQAVVIGSAIVAEIDRNFCEKKSSNEIVAAAGATMREFAQAIKS